MILDQYFFSGRNIPGYFVETGAQEHLGSYTWGMCGWEVQSPSRWAWAQGHVRILSATLLVSICLRSCLLSIPKETCRMIWSYLIVIESVDGKWWQQQEAFEPFALLCDFTSDTAHCAACAKLCESVWVVFVLILSLAEDRCDFNHLRDSHPQPGRFSDDTASTKRYNKLSWKMPRISFSTLNSVLKSPLKYVRCLWFPDLTEVYCLDSNND